jgi:DNA repair protein SbcD/Mre11
MAVKPVRILLLADTHLGFDQTARPRIKRRRRGDDFFKNYVRALRPALQGQVDIVVHGGDLLFRSKVPAGLVQKALQPLFAVADSGVKVFLVPGNHERSRIPFRLLAGHSGLHIFDKPQTFCIELHGQRVALSGFPCDRDQVRRNFRTLLSQTGYKETQADIRLLCLHQAFEGARVGPHNYTFRYSPDVIKAADLPAGFAAVLCGHIHRQQVLSHDLGGGRLACPVFYPGSIERTSRAEKDEAKGFFTIELSSAQPGGQVGRYTFNQLPARPMVDLVLEVKGLDPLELKARLEHEIEKLDPDSIVRIEPLGPIGEDSRQILKAESLRGLAPASMNISLLTKRPFQRRDS